MNASILLVTWFIVGQAPSSYQVKLGDLKSCDTARTALLHDAETLRGTAPIPPPPPGFQVMPSQGNADTVSASQYPKVSAICVQTNEIVDWKTYFGSKTSGQ
jgi:hypothetical protein